MTGLETQVRKALINQRTDELVRYAAEYPKHKEMAMELVEITVDSIFRLMKPIFGEANKKEMAEMKQEFRKEMLPQIQAQLDNPKQLRKIMYKQAKIQYMSIKQLKAKLKHHFAEMREDDEIEEEIISNYEKSYEDLFEFVKTNDKIVRRLVKVAEIDGSDKATQKETRYAIIREIFPTPDEYRRYLHKGIKTAESFIQQAQSTLMAGGETGQALSGMFGAIGKVTKKSQEFQGNCLERTIQEIYR